MEPIKVEPVYVETVENKIPTELEWEGRIYRLVKTHKEQVEKTEQVLKQKAVVSAMKKGKLLDKGELFCKVHGNNVWSNPFRELKALKSVGKFNTERCYGVLKKYYDVKPSSLPTILSWYKNAMDKQGADHLYKVLLDMWRSGEGRNISNIVRFSGMSRVRVEQLLVQLKAQGRVKQYGDKFNPKTESKKV